MTFLPIVVSVYVLGFYLNIFFQNYFKKYKIYFKIIIFPVYSKTYLQVCLKDLILGNKFVYLSCSTANPDKFQFVILNKSFSAERNIFTTVIFRLLSKNIGII